MNGQIYGIIGHPLGHTLSPDLHNWGFARLGLPHKLYCRWPLPPEEIALFLKSFRLLEISGISVTIPHKETIIPYIDGLSPQASRIGAVNTLYWSGDKVLGTNTDIKGFTTPLLSAGLDLDSALVLGAGGASKAALYALKEMGIRTTVTNRGEEKAQSRANELGIDFCAWEKRHKVTADLLVNTTPLGMQGEKSGGSPWEKSMRPFKAVYDIIYNPVWTPFLQQAAEENKPAISGLCMFVSQGLEQFRIWTGLELDYNSALDHLGGILDIQNIPAC